jgi:quinol monooxygenase YgiN
MYGTIGQAHIEDGKLSEVLALGETWNRERGPKVPGAIAAYWFQSDGDPNLMTIVAIFRDRETYHANANDPGQDAWYQQLRPLLASDTTWNDGEVVFAGMFNGI